jgi:hypothetical protein
MTQRSRWEMLRGRRSFGTSGMIWFMNLCSINLEVSFWLVRSQGSRVLTLPNC